MARGRIRRAMVRRAENKRVTLPSREAKALEHLSAGDPSRLVLTIIREG
ncbi:hypothetical protein [Aeropyrum camini]|nr:hypothetical protein [Aeropyrum camini]